MTDDGHTPAGNGEADPETDAGIGIEAARKKLGELVVRAAFANERIRLTRKGKPVAAIIGMTDLERLESLDAA